MGRMTGFSPLSFKSILAPSGSNLKSGHYALGEKQIICLRHVRIIEHHSELIFIIMLQYWARREE